jgi:ATP-dependent Clp protease ATP-binding subunit ClpA
MWQRFTERARKVVFYAQEEAQKFGQGYVSTEHLLLGICREGDTTASKILASLGCSGELIRAALETQLPREAAHPSQDMTLTPRAKRVIDLAYEEATLIADGFIGTEHLLLGLIREEQGLAGRVLAKFGIGIQNAREKLGEVRAEQGNPVGVRSEKSSDRSGPPETAASFAERIGYRALLIRQGICLPEFFGMILLADASVKNLLSRVEVSTESVVNAIQAKITSALSLSDRRSVWDLQKVLEMADEEALRSRMPFSSCHLLIALVRDEENELSVYVRAQEVSVDALRAALVS